MKRTLLVTLALALPAVACRTVEPDYGRPLPEGAPALIPLGPDEPLPDFAVDWDDRHTLLAAVDRSITWTRRAHAQRFFPQAGIEHHVALASLERFRELLESSPDGASFAAALADEFQVYKSAGWNGEGGGVLFTGYCTPLLAGSVEWTPTYRWPLYALPPDLVKGKDGEILGMETAAGLRPYPTRRAIEAGALLADRGLELVWLADPVDAFVAHVNGSAFIELEDGGMLRFGYAGKNGREYRSLGLALVEDGVLSREEVSLASIREWAARTSEADVLEYLYENRSYVFFTPIEGNPHGSLDFDVEAWRTIATDKRLFPRGAVTFVETSLPGAEGLKNTEVFERFLLDQDTGGAIRTAGRADIYLGIGHEAESLAGRTRAEGQLYYLFLKPENVPAAP